MHRRLTATAATAALLTLAAGCSSATPHAQAVNLGAASPSASPAASTAPATSPSASQYPSGNPGMYLMSIGVLAKQPGVGLAALKAMSSEQLLALGHLACTELRKPTPPVQVRNDLEGRNLSVDAAASVLIAAANSQLGLCPDQNDRVKAWTAQLG